MTTFCIAIYFSLIFLLSQQTWRLPGRKYRFFIEKEKEKLKPQEIIFCLFILRLLLLKSLSPPTSPRMAGSSLSISCPVQRKQDEKPVGSHRDVFYLR
jgi:hypothetical protein